MDPNATSPLNIAPSTIHLNAQVSVTHSVLYPDSLVVKLDRPGLSPAMVQAIRETFHKFDPRMAL
jgi:hypothetical protein